MITLPEISDLFGRLASHLQTLDPSEDEARNLAISNLNRSLNLNEEGSRVRVLDIALSLMCFKAPQVFDSVIEYSVKTIVTVLSSSISCKVARFQKDEILHIGSSLSCHDSMELIEVCTDIIGKLKGYGVLSLVLSYAVVRVIVSASCYQYMFPSTLMYVVKSNDGRSAAISKLLCHLPKEISNKDNEVPLRLLLWFLDPLTLKHDISKILQDTIRRPFLCLNKEFHEKMDWRSIIICLVLSPTMYIETRALLHNWFLLTGLASVLELLSEIVSAILDVLARPTWWGLSLEMGSKLPFSNAYFPYKHHLLRILAGPLLSDSVLRLVHNISEPVSCTRKHSGQTTKQASMEATRIDHKSSWAIAMNFPDWFLFASSLLFLERTFQDNFNSKCTLEASGNDQVNEVKAPSSAAARYIAWILSPTCQSQQDLLCDFLTKLSGLWTEKQFGTGTHKETVGYKKKLKKPKIHNKEEDFTVDSQAIVLWLKEFQKIYTRCWDNSCGSSHGLSLKRNVLFRRIPLGILIKCCNKLSDDVCELLLHYAATGIVLELKETKGAVLKNLRDQDDTIIWKEAVAGACLVFNLTDAVERMSASMLETEESGLDFICRVKERAGRYLIKCSTKLLQLKFDGEDGVSMLTDLCSRLVGWRHQGRAVFQGYKDLDIIINDLSLKLSCS